MPKIIKNIKEKLLEEAKKQLLEEGYSALTIRSVASKCNVGVGTVYNYFPSKDMLVASFMLEDWHKSYMKLIKCMEENEEVEIVLRCIYDELKAFASIYNSLFHDEKAEINYKIGSGHRHVLLREQLAKIIAKYCIHKENKDFLSLFIAESILTWTFSEYHFDDIVQVLLPLLK